ncbi:hypothetical protein TNIN_501031 [Trichonephila inaurata madagascariensis]|uniref:Uncharacterized protein n=1 Tax=Trichonephila inaurata madagascariensis TaxID=2747483 RepID=A0A8X7BTA8_9ARAC|nr:hypothetical protein TNIN_501031 [Trichonephila inaurata madagascariensis]
MGHQILFFTLFLTSLQKRTNELFHKVKPFPPKTHSMPNIIPKTISLFSIPPIKFHSLTSSANKKPKLSSEESGSEFSISASSHHNYRIVSQNRKK